MLFLVCNCAVSRKSNIPFFNNYLAWFWRISGVYSRRLTTFDKTWSVYVYEARTT